MVDLTVSSKVRIFGFANKQVVHNKQRLPWCCFCKPIVTDNFHKQKMICSKIHSSHAHINTVQISSS